MSDVVGNPEDRFSQNEAQFIVAACLNDIIMLDDFLAKPYTNLKISLFSTIKLHRSVGFVDHLLSNAASKFTEWHHYTF